MQRSQTARVTIDGELKILLCSNYYLGLANHPPRGLCSMCQLGFAPICIIAIEGGNVDVGGVAGDCLLIFNF